MLGTADVCRYRVRFKTLTAHVPRFQSKGVKKIGPRFLSIGKGCFVRELSYGESSPHKINDHRKNKDAAQPGRHPKRIDVIQENDRAADDIQSARPY